MASIPFQWDERIPIYDSERYYLRNHFGVSQRVQNALTVLELTNSTEWTRIHKGILALRDTIKTADSGAESLQLHRVPYTSESLSIVVLWGIVLNGGRRKKALTGDWYFVIVHAEEEADVTRQVFKQ